MHAHGAVAAANARIRSFVDHRSRTTGSPTLEPADRAMLDFAVRLTQSPDRCEEEDVEELREAGFSDEDILHIVELTAIVNYDGRLANGLGLIPNPEYHRLGRRLDQ